jgi:hypothetical protein
MGLNFTVLLDAEAETFHAWGGQGPAHQRPDRSSGPVAVCRAGAPGVGRRRGHRAGRGPPRRARLRRGRRLSLVGPAGHPGQGSHPGHLLPGPDAGPKNWLPLPKIAWSESRGCLGEQGGSGAPRAPSCRRAALGCGSASLPSLP